MTNYTEQFFDLDACQEQLHNDFIDNIAPSIVEQYSMDDECALDESFNNWTDSLCKDGELCTYAYENIDGIDWDDYDVIKRLKKACA